jgi:uncharacterized repeat protein (TIGR03803 family)
MQSQRMQEHGNFSTASGLCQLMAAILVCAALAIPAAAQTFVVLHKFNGKDGSEPYTPLVQGFDGQFYGSTSEGGSSSGCTYLEGCGTVFQIGRYGKVTTLHDFCSQADCADGAFPGPLILGAYGTLYGTTPQSGNLIAPGGTAFAMSPTGALSTLYHFCSLANCADGAVPLSVILGFDGSLHGTTASGTIFRLTRGGVLTTTHVFCPTTDCSNSEANPFNLIQATDGNLYGTTKGSVFRTGPNGFSTVYDFCPQDSCTVLSTPTALIQGADGDLYGVTFFGGAYGEGSIFRLTTSGVLTTLYSFCATFPSCPDGFQPTALLQASDGNFYGATQSGGGFPPGFRSKNWGTIFSFNPGGKFTTLHVFTLDDGNLPMGLTQGTDGAFYGTTVYGGALINGARRNGVVFRLDVGLGPFVRPVLTFGHVGDHVSILGTDMTDVTSVSFNGTPAPIISFCETHIATTVPEGATSGPITVTTASGTLTSNVAFTVLP